MTAYFIFQVILSSYSVVMILFGLWSTATKIKYSFKIIRAEQEIFKLLNKLHGKKYVLVPFLLWQYAALISWLMLALPQIDNILCLNLISNYSWDRGFVTWYGNFKGMPGNIYCLSLLFNIVAILGNLVCGKMARILISGYINIGDSGRWGLNREFSKYYNGNIYNKL